MSCANCGGTGVCPMCAGDPMECSWCYDGKCPDCNKTPNIVMIDGDYHEVMPLNHRETSE